MEASAATPADRPAPVSPPPIFEIADLGKPQNKWQLVVHEGHLALSETATAQPYVLLRTGFPKEFNFSERLRALSVTKPFKATLKLSPEATVAVTRWFGDSFLAATYLKRRYGFILPWAIIWIIAALPLPGNEARGVEPKPFEVVDFVIGLVLAGAWVISRWRPHPVLFLVDALWFTYLMVQLSLGILAGRSNWWGLMVVVLAFTAATGLQHFLRFRRTKLERLRNLKRGRD